MKLPFWRVNAFADGPFSGNPAAVVAVERLPAETTMQAVAAELALPATAFVTPGRKVRWWSATGEIALCGHGALAAGHALLGGVDGKIVFETVRGEAIEVRREAGRYALSLPAIPTVPGNRPDVAALLGAPPLEAWCSPDRYGIYLFDSEEQVRALTPDWAALAQADNEQFACSARGTASDVVSRVFVGGPGAREDAVTGSAHAALAPFWVPRLGRDSFTAHQASARGGSLTCRVEGDRVWLGGRCVTVAEGSVYLPG